MTSGVHGVRHQALVCGQQVSGSLFAPFHSHFKLLSERQKESDTLFHATMASAAKIMFALLATVLCSLIGCEAIRCYQCSSDTDPDGQDICGAYNKFDTYKNIPIECSNQDSKTPGTFCVKITKQSPRGFIWDGRWRQVIRRCASVTNTGVTGVCNWGVEENGVYWEECSCSNDSCNGATSLFATSTLFVTAFGVVYSIFLWT